MRIAMVTSEVNPFSKTGGLADVVFALSKDLQKLDQEVVIVCPFYGSINRSMLGEDYKLVATYNVQLDWRTQEARVFEIKHAGLTYYFIENEYYFSRHSMYSYDDDSERFAFFTLASEQLFPYLNLPVDIIHIHDWQAGMLPMRIKEGKSHYDFYKNTKFVLSIHNPAFQGLFNVEDLGGFYNLAHSYGDNPYLRVNGQISSLKAAIMYVDKLNTVSPTHALELLTPEGGKGLESVIALRGKDFSGILNGIDYEEFNPETDRLIAKNFGKTTIKSGKKGNRNALFTMFNLPKTTAPIYAIVSRLTWQKGIDLILAGANYILDRGGVFLVLGSGEYETENAFKDLAAKYPNQVGLYIGYSNEIAHALYAGADFFMMPSLFEPCGSGQMIAFRYATLPLVRYTGGLKDTVVGYDGTNLKVANGFGFADYNIDKMVETVKLSYDVYEQKDIFHQLQKNAFNENNDWSQSAQRYLNLYEQI